jgi:tetratricopeptide (TPR) repeat protein
MADTKIAPGTLKKVVDGQAPLNTFVGLTKDQIDAIAAMGFRLYEQGRARDASSIFEGLVALDSKLYYGYAGLGAMALQEGKLDEALHYLTRAAELNPKDPTVHANLGETLLRQAKFDAAAAEFEKALKLDPQERDPGANRARAIVQGMGVVAREIQRVGAA